MYVWRKRAERRWVKAHEALLQAHAHGQLVIVQKPDRQRVELEIVCRSRRDSTALLNEFGGQWEALPRNWLKRFARGNSKPIRIGNRLVISNVGETSGSRQSQHTGPSRITIPAALAFGTGEHATTAMSLRFLEQVSRNWKRGWSLVDLGTGTGILALAARRLGAGRVAGLDNDPAAISTAKSNARLNKFLGIRFQLADVREWNSSQRIDVITANLYSDLLIEVLPKLPEAGLLILSGILVSQQNELTLALHQNGYDIIKTKRRGRWVAVLARRTASMQPSCPEPANFCGRLNRRYSKRMQSEQLAYAIVTPYSMRKSRTGGIVGRLISRTGLDLVGGRMFAPGAELTKRYADTIVTETETDPSHRATQQLIREYVLKNFTGEKDGQNARVLFLLFRGPDAVEKIHEVVGHILHERTSGETIRDTYGDYITDESENVVYFEPGVVTEFDPDAVQRDLKLWAEFSDSDGGIVERALSYPPGTSIEKTLVLIKPDNFRFPNLRPGGVIEVFSRTGLSIIGFKVHQMSVAQAEEFYGPVLPVLEKKLGPKSGRENWESIVEFMAGKKPSECRPEERDAPGTEKSIAIVYQGVDAVRKIRDVLGPTDPAKAPPGSIRKEFGQTIMVNAAHASDSVENAKREMAIIRVDENNFKPLIENFYRRQ